MAYQWICVTVHPKVWWQTTICCPTLRKVLKIWNVVCCGAEKLRTALTFPPKKISCWSLHLSIIDHRLSKQKGMEPTLTLKLAIFCSKWSEPLAGFYYGLCPCQVDSSSWFFSSDLCHQDRIWMGNPTLYSCHQKKRVREIFQYSYLSILVKTTQERKSPYFVVIFLKSYCFSGTGMENVNLSNGIQQINWQQFKLLYALIKTKKKKLGYTYTLKAHSQAPIRYENTSRGSRD